MKLLPRTVLLLAAVLLAAGACAAPSANDPADESHRAGITAGNEVTITYGTHVDVSDANLHVTFDSVAEDSRCPSTVQCVWAGRAVVKLTTGPILGFQIVQSVTLSTEAGRDTAIVFGQPLKLLRVEPTPTTVSAPSAGAYRIALRVGADKD